MKVCILKPNNPSDFLQKLSVHFSESKREATREHIQLENNTKYVWFEDEEPPPELIEAIEESYERMSDGTASDDSDT